MTVRPGIASSSCTVVFTRGARRGVAAAEARAQESKEEALREAQERAEQERLLAEAKAKAEAERLRDELDRAQQDAETEAELAGVVERLDAPVVARVPATTCATGLPGGNASSRARPRTIRCIKVVPHRVSMRVSASARTCPLVPRDTPAPPREQHLSDLELHGVDPSHRGLPPRREACQQLRTVEGLGHNPRRKLRHLVRQAEPSLREGGRQPARAAERAGPRRACRIRSMAWTRPARAAAACPSSAAG